MAEYINKKYLDRKFQIDMMALRSGTIFDTKKIIDSLPTADVIEIPKNATNGDMIKAMFPSLKIANDGLINDNLTGIMAFYGGYDSPLSRGDNYFNRKWWDAPYKEVNDGSN